MEINDKGPRTASHKIMYVCTFMKIQYAYTEICVNK